jgi:hypothetical protein
MMSVLPLPVAILNRKFGYVLSGADEEKMWRQFSDISEMHSQSINPVKLHIPEMSSLTGQHTTALDINSNVTAEDSPTTVISKVLASLATLRRGNAISYVLRHVFFSLNRSFDVEVGGAKRQIRSMEELCDVVDKCSAEKEAIAESIAREICDLFAGKYAV